ncbi:amidinotransferase, partial [Streptomyces sp. AC563]|nr:amidinotransferase [Streptomyces buecherae]
MCPPTHFKVSYSINPWMDPDKPVDLALARTQWEVLRDRYRALGHTVEELSPDPALPDMVFAANGALVVEGRVLGARFAHPERTAEAAA